MHNFTHFSTAPSGVVYPTNNSVEKSIMLQVPIPKVAMANSLNGETVHIITPTTNMTADTKRENVTL